ncbi:ALK-EXO [Buzura suppressaria nucleopolyhedrovirus]|uniref:ALK-EXO n=1 Tax=Buzura suppressaria nuclear polyhedrosis virus TaxID=74320 RepID=W5VKL8_NPVBS|nr:ALK-EXO [Buzura suppressaria nucleopolyhedrovirus]AHH82705.1 ALK-EXO [Buzura suppressaria nucleopolyhedrovirus]AKN91089.1 ALK-EXO [Buzura suppressaria nucleopolyhedrovirus]QYF10653.1 alkaline exonuclease protein [Buzura suppressaria nucleopolyhedrovirus]
MDGLTKEQKQICEKYSYREYVARLGETPSRLDRDEILRIERLTRGQHENLLWRTLRLDRQTASKSNNQQSLLETAAMSFGIVNEKVVKGNNAIMDSVRKAIEYKLNTQIVESVLDCGLFFTPLGLFSASPDAYFVTRENILVPLEIKCPLSYKETTVDEMRNSMNVRKQRYRVKHTALSVNRIGEPVFAVEKTDAHYRQMQRQIYVLDAPICVYLVKFKDSHVIQVVERDEQFTRQEHENEKKVYTGYVQRFKARKKFSTLHNRRVSFVNQNHMYTEKEVTKLAERGFYYMYGEIECVYCFTKFNTEIGCAALLELHSCIVQKNQLIATVRNPNYFDHSKRTMSLLDRHLDPRLADQGVFFDTAQQNLVTFCCNVLVKNGIDVEHDSKCNYNSIVNSIK